MSSDPLLQLLRRKARSSDQDLADLLASDHATVAARVATWETDGTILGYHAVIDPEATGDTSVSAFIEVKVTPERGGGFDRLAMRIARFDQVVSLLPRQWRLRSDGRRRRQRPSRSRPLRLRKTQFTRRRDFHGHPFPPEDLQGKRLPLRTRSHHRTAGRFALTFSKFLLPSLSCCRQFEQTVHISTLPGGLCRTIATSHSSK